MELQHNCTITVHAVQGLTTVQSYFTTVVGAQSAHVQVELVTENVSLV